jgi:hypothetical protein
MLLARLICHQIRFEISPKRLARMQLRLSISAGLLYVAEQRPAIRRRDASSG